MTHKEKFVQAMMEKGESKEYAEMRFEQIQDQKKADQSSMEERRELARLKSNILIEKTAQQMVNGLNKLHREKEEKEKEERRKLAELKADKY